VSAPETPAEIRAAINGPCADRSRCWLPTWESYDTVDPEGLPLMASFFVCMNCGFVYVEHERMT
jgi:hypothetical protein